MSDRQIAAFREAMNQFHAFAMRIADTAEQADWNAWDIAQRLDIAGVFDGTLERRAFVEPNLLSDLIHAENRIEAFGAERSAA